MPTTTATANDICTRALKMAGLCQGGGAPAAEDSADAFEILNGMLDAWTMDRLFIYDNAITVFALTSGQQSYDIGAGAAAPFNVARPSRIQAANLVISGSGAATRIPLVLLDDAGWMSIVVRDVGSTYPTCLYYSSSFPLGQLNFWPTPSAGLSVELDAWTELTQFADPTTPFSFPPGYFEAIYQNLALRLCTPEWGLNEVPQSVAARANESRQRIQSLNMNPPPLMMPDAGTQGVRDGQGYRNLYNPSPIWTR